MQAKQKNAGDWTSGKVADFSAMVWWRQWRCIQNGYRDRELLQFSICTTGFASKDDDWRKKNSSQSRHTVSTFYIWFKAFPFFHSFSKACTHEFPFRLSAWKWMESKLADLLCIFSNGQYVSATWEWLIGIGYIRRETVAVKVQKDPRKS